MRYGLTILPEHRWADAAPVWRRAEDLGFDHAWTYDHLVWAGLPHAPWFSTFPTLVAAASVTRRIPLGTHVASPNYRHPYLLARDVLTLDDICGGRVLLGMGAGGDLDAGILGQGWSRRERTERFEEAVPLVRRLLREDHVDHAGTHFTTVDARTLPGPVGRPPSLVVAATGPRALRVAATSGDAWVTNGVWGSGEPEGWWRAVRESAARMREEMAAAGRAEGPGTAYPWYLSLDAGPAYSLQSIGLFDEMVGRAEELGFTDVVLHHPRPDGPFAGDPAILDEVAARIAARDAASLGR